MNIVTIGLGNFGASLAKTLTSMGHEVLGVDNDLSKVEYRKEMHLKIIALKRNHRIVYSSAQAVDNEDKIEIDFRENDILVLVGEIRDIRRFLHE